MSEMKIYKFMISYLSLPHAHEQNSPQYIATSDLDKELELQYRVHAALDVVEEKCVPGQKPTPDSRDLYLGMLYSTETHKMYEFSNLLCPQYFKIFHYPLATAM